MSDQQTCGRGLAANAVLPAKMAELAGAIAAVLEHHMTALDLADAASRTEYGAYRNLSGRYRRLDSDLSAVADEMAGYSDLPMGRHDMEIMSSPPARQVLRELVMRERELAALLEQRVSQYQDILRQMGDS